MIIDNIGLVLFFAALTVLAPFVVGFVLNRQFLMRHEGLKQQLDTVHLLVNSQKTTLEQQLAAAITEIIELKGQLMSAVQQIGVLQERTRTEQH